MPRFSKTFATFLLLVVALSLKASAATNLYPNVVLIMTDDQGYGDLGHHGNPVLNTPNLDAFANEASTFRQFYVSPVCSPTRSSLMTGRYNYRTGVVDTWLGRSMMFENETTLAEIMRQAGYQTGIFGKWHLGDNYPMRPQDQGFQDVLVHMGGGIGQPADPPGNTYFDPIVNKDGKQVKSKGYCTDVFTDGALDFFYENRRKPFFAYIAYNAPHTPLQVPEEYHKLYKDRDLSPGQFPSKGQPIQEAKNLDDIARVYGMVQNIDDNFGRIVKKLEELGLRDNTILIFLTDNGPQQPRYNGGLRGLKGSVFEGGIRVPFYLQWPARLKKRSYDIMAAHIDVAPTLLDLCGIPVPNNVLFDGRSLAPLLTLQAGRKLSWPSRTLYFQWHRGDIPQKHQAFAARTQRYKLVQPKGIQEGSYKGTEPYMLFDIQNDPYETTDIADENPEVVKEMKRRYSEWFDEMAATRGFEQPFIEVATQHENPSTLTRQDWRGPKASWRSDGLGHWDVIVPKEGRYHIGLRFEALANDGKVHFRLGDVSATEPVKKGATEHTFRNIKMDATGGKLEAWVEEASQQRGVHYVEVRRRIW